MRGARLVPAVDIERPRPTRRLREDPKVWTTDTAGWTPACATFGWQYSRPTNDLCLARSSIGFFVESVEHLMPSIVLAIVGVHDFQPTDHGYFFLGATASLASLPES